MYFVLIILIWIFFSSGTNHLSFHYFLWGNSLWYKSALDYKHISATNNARKPKCHCTSNIYIKKATTIPYNIITRTTIRGEDSISSMLRRQNEGGTENNVSRQDAPLDYLTPVGTTSGLLPLLS
jgi:hypothetical protein